MTAWKACDAECPHGHSCSVAPHRGGTHYCYQCNCVYDGPPDVLTLHMHDGRSVLHHPAPATSIQQLASEIYERGFQAGLAEEKP